MSCVLSCKKETKPVIELSVEESTLDELNRLISKDTLNHKLLFQRAQWFYEKEDFDSSIDDLRLAINLDAQQPHYYHILSDVLMDYYRSNEALQVMEKAAQTFPERIPTLLKLSETQHILKQFEASLYTIAKIMTIDPQNAEAYFMMGLNFRSSNEIDRAINAFQTATELDPQLVDAWLILGKLFENKNNGLALQYYEAAINVDQNNPATWHSKAFYLQNNGKIEEAIDLYKKIITIDKYYLDAYLNSGILYMELDSFPEAFEQFNILTNLKSEYYIAYYYRGLASAALGKTEQAKTDFQNCLNFNPSYTKAKLALDNLNK